ncbi:MAG: hypothetical protein IPG50_30595 [Myxococcales bacterium]|nr:hypothetical protein [Myxococcales bacterium]
MNNRNALVQPLEPLDAEELTEVSGGLPISFFMALFAALSGPPEHGAGGSPGDGVVPGDGVAGP